MHARFWPAGALYRAERYDRYRIAAIAGVNLTGRGGSIAPLNGHSSLARGLEGEGARGKVVCMSHEPRLRDYLTGDKVASLLRVARKSPRQGARNHAMILFACRHGLRASELVNLRVSDCPATIRFAARKK